MVIIVVVLVIALAILGGFAAFAISYIVNQQRRELDEAHDRIADLQGVVRDREVSLQLVLEELTRA